jgi:hypothetical protein
MAYTILELVTGKERRQTCYSSAFVIQATAFQLSGSFVSKIPQEDVLVTSYEAFLFRGNQIDFSQS